MYNHLNYNNVLACSEEVTRIVNATKHPLCIFANDPCTIRPNKRKHNEYVLVSPDIEPVRKFDVDYTLSFQERHTFSINVGSVQFSMPKNREIPQIPSSFLKKDVIVVSKDYAIVLSNNLRSDLDFDYLDRLYIDGPKVFDSDSKNRTLVGTTCLEKFVYPNGGKNIYAYPYYGDNRYGFREMNSYIEAYRAGRSPSLAAVVMLLNYLPALDSSIVRNHTYMDLYYCAMNDIQKRQSGSSAQMPIIYNV